MEAMQRAVHYLPATSRHSNKLRVAAYCRVSSLSEDQLESYAAQVEHYQQIIEENPAWELVAIYADEGLTGTRSDTRPDFQRLLRDARKGRIDKVLIKSISRFARNTRDSLTSIRELKSLGVEVFFEKERLDTATMTGEMMLSFFSAGAQEESISISQNMRWSYQRRMQSGEYLCCRAPYGYELVEREHIINELESPVVQRIFDEYLAGMSMTNIARRLEDEGIPKQGGHWNDKSVYTILNNEKYAGNTLLQKRYRTEEVPFRECRNKGERAMYYVEDSHPVIVSLDIFNRAQALIKQRSTPCSMGIYPFSLKIRCGLCGTVFKRRVVNGKTYWVCRRHDVYAASCTMKRIPEPLLEQAFVRLICKLRTFRHELLVPMIEQLRTLKSRAFHHDRRISEIDREVLSLVRQSLILNRLRGQNLMDTAYFHEQSQGINQAVNALHRERRRLLEDYDWDEDIDALEALLDCLGQGSVDQTYFDEKLFAEIVEGIVIGDTGMVDFKLKGGLTLTERLVP